MNFKCPECGKVFKRDLRSKMTQYFYSKKKNAYKTTCTNDKSYWCKQTNEKATE